MASEDVKANTSQECRESCVFCQSDGESNGARELKILKCLHVSCKSCAGQFLTLENSIECARCQIVTPDPGPGRKLTECLVSWPTQQSVACADSDADEQDESSPGHLVQSSGKVEPALYCQNSDCEDMNEPAEMRCTTCDRLLCRQHSALHTRSRKRANHRMAAVTAAKRRMKERDDIELCPLHNEDLRSYCKSCNVLMCVRCTTSKQHADRCKHDLVDVKDAAKGLRDAEAVLQSEIPDLENRLAAVEARIDTINKETEEISKTINSDYSAALKIIEDSREELLGDLDEERWRAVKQLETLKEARQEELRTRKTGGYLSTTLNDWAVLRAFSQRTSKYPPGPGTSKAERGASGSEQRYSSDEDSKSEEDDEVKESYEHKEDGEDPENCELEFTFKRAFARYVKILAWVSQKPNLPDFKHHHHITIQQWFSCQTPGRISLNDARTQALSTTWKVGWSTASSKKPPPVPFRVQLLTGQAIIGFVSQAAPMADSVKWPHDSGRFYGWSSTKHHRILTVGGELGQYWVKGDVLRLTLDKKGRSATAVHERTGISETIRIDKDQFPVCFTAELGPRATVRLLPIQLF